MDISIDVLFVEPSSRTLLGGEYSCGDIMQHVYESLTYFAHKSFDD